jgi:hypothetical protein
VDNLTIADVTQQFSPRSSVTLGGGFGLTDYLNKPDIGFPVINSEQTTAQVGYDRILNRHDQIGILYAFQEFHFPEAHAGTINAHVWNVLYGHRITGRLNLTLSGGPQLVEIRNPPLILTLLGQTLVVPIPTTKIISGNGSATLGYTASARTGLQFQFQHYVTPGSGFFAGANTTVARFAANHAMGRRWSTSADIGYTYNSVLQNASSTGINASSYQYWYLGLSVRRQLGQTLSAFASYQFSDFGSSTCSVVAARDCGLRTNTSVGQLGISWHPHPIRLD